MRPSPKLAKQCRLSEGYGHKNAWLPTGSVLNDPKPTNRDLCSTHGRLPWYHATPARLRSGARDCDRSERRRDRMHHRNNQLVLGVTLYNFVVLR